MTIPVVFKDVDFHQYTITEDCIIRKNGCSINVDDSIYHSTNGYDYVLLETLDHKLKLYRLEFIMVSSFNPGIQHKWEHFKVIHLDGDIKNCHIDNLTFEEDVEEWRIIEYPEWIKRNQYAVSSWGRVKNIETNKIVTPIISSYGYCIINFVHNGIDVKTSYRFIPKAIHIVEMLNFSKYEPDRKYAIINHIDGDKSNNHISNLEIVTQSENAKHAFYTGISKVATKLDQETIDVIIKSLNENNGSSVIVFDKISKIYPDISIHDIRHVKCCNIDRIIYQKIPEGTLSKIPTKDVDMVIAMLLDPVHNGSPTSVFKALNHDEYPNITRSVIDHIKRKSRGYIRADSVYDIKNLTFPRCR